MPGPLQGEQPGTCTHPQPVHLLIVVLALWASSHGPLARLPTQRRVSGQEVQLLASSGLHAESFFPSRACAAWLRRKANGELCENQLWCQIAYPAGCSASKRQEAEGAAWTKCACLGLHEC